MIIHRIWFAVTVLLTIASCRPQMTEEEVSDRDSAIAVLREYETKLGELNDEIDRARVVRESMIDSANDKDLENMIFYNISRDWDIPENASPAVVESALSKFNTEQKTFFSTLYVERNVLQGGFERITRYKTSISTATLAIQGYRNLKCDELAEITSKALKIDYHLQREPAVSYKEINNDFKTQIAKLETGVRRIELIRRNKVKFITRNP
jgi:hypothetical protein